MKSHLKELISIEFLKLLKNKINYVYLIIILITVLASSFGIKLIENQDNTPTGYSYILLSLQTVSTTIMPVMLLLFAASTITTEKTSGTVRNILVTGCSKKEFLSSKIIASFVFQLILMATAAILAILIGYTLFGFGNISEDGFIIMTQNQFWIQFLFSYFLLALILFAVISFGIMVSTLMQNNVTAITTAIGTYIVLESIKTKLHIGNLLYSSYIEFPLNTLNELTEGFRTSWTPQLYYYLIISIAWISFPLFIAFLVIKKLEFK